MVINTDNQIYVNKVQRSWHWLTGSKLKLVRQVKVTSWLTYTFDKHQTSNSKVWTTASSKSSNQHRLSVNNLSQLRINSQLHKLHSIPSIGVKTSNTETVSGSYSTNQKKSSLQNFQYMFISYYKSPSINSKLKISFTGSFQPQEVK